MPDSVCSYRPGRRVTSLPTGKETLESILLSLHVKNGYVEKGILELIRYWDAQNSADKISAYLENMELNPAFGYPDEKEMLLHLSVLISSEDPAHKKLFRDALKTRDLLWRQIETHFKQIWRQSGGHPGAPGAVSQGNLYPESLYCDTQCNTSIHYAIHRAIRIQRQPFGRPLFLVGGCRKPLIQP